LPIGRTQRVPLPICPTIARRSSASEKRGPDTLMAEEIPHPPPRFGWRRAASVLSWLFTEPWQFDFFQAIRLLEFAKPDAAPPGESTDPDVELVHLAASSSLSTPASEIQSLEARPDPGTPPLLRVNFSSLAGPAGPLPYPDTERMLERSWRKDDSMRDFLDIFHHRILSLIVRVRKAHLPPFIARDPSEGNVASFLFALVGLRMYPGASPAARAPAAQKPAPAAQKPAPAAQKPAPAAQKTVPAARSLEVSRLRPLRNRLGVPDRVLLYYSGILTSHPRSASGLECLFSDYFGTPCRVEQLKGVWRTLDPGQWTRIGRTGQNNILGQTAMAGTRIWDQQGAVELYLGPMPLVQFVSFLPTGDSFKTACGLMAFYAGPDLQFRIRLGIRARQAPLPQLAAQPGAATAQTRLGWTSWLRTRPFTADDNQVVLSPALPGR
jgi:type VI secretion system protein ImpH